MGETRKIRNIYTGKPTIEGAGVHLKRIFGYYEAPEFDPFLLLDDFSSDSPDLYLSGFPWHPHRGIETITYILDGEVEHGDSLGNMGIISSGDVQWMTAGSGIIHQEMPKGNPRGVMSGFQLWANLPAKDKMMDPRYRDIKNEQIPEIKFENGTIVKIIAGKINNIKGPVNDIVIDPEYIDIRIPEGEQFIHEVKKGYTLFAYVYDGNGYFDNKNEFKIGKNNLVLFEDGSKVIANAKDDSLRFLLISGKPLNEPVAWRGPIVMNTQEELNRAFEEYHNGTFIKVRD